MYRLIIFLIAASFAVGCNNANEHREAVSSLSEDWDETTAKVDSFSQSLNAEISNWNNVYQGMTVTDTSFAEFPAETTQKLASLKEECQMQGQVFSQLKSNLNDFRSQWLENTNEVTSLKAGAENGELAADTEVQIENLKQIVSDADDRVDQWFNQLEDAKKNCEKASKQYAELIDQEMENEG